MEINRISSDLKFINQLGATLNLEEKMKLELSLIKISEKEKYDQVLFWGKIEGTAKDYYIAIGLKFKEQFEFPTKKFYWSSNDFKFSELPEMNMEYKEYVRELRSFFTGQHEKILVNLAGDQLTESQQEEEDEEHIKDKPKNFTELDRLAFVVRKIDHDCALAPVGAFKLTPTHELRYNDSFKGLKIEEISTIVNYQHFRAPESQEKKDFIARDDALFHFNFLDPLEKDIPKGCWSIQSDASKTNVTVRSLVWPGFTGYHRANSNIFGNIYIGNGIRNCDLPFLL